MAFLGFKEILELIDKVAASGISSVEIESAGVTLRIEGARAEEIQPSPQPTAAMTQPAPAQPAPVAIQPAPAPMPADADAIDPNWHIVTSPIVGTFYRAPNPETEPFVNEGDKVSRGKVLCIVEAMKLMNEIESDADGVVVKIFPQNGQPIEYGEKLFAIRR